jgi:transcriptional regulator with XRE-family HTH domain
MPKLSKMTQAKGASMPHNGQLVQQILESRKITKSELARQLGVSPGGVHSYLNQPTLHAALLWKIGQVVDYNFFADLSSVFTVKAPTPLELAQQQQIAQLTMELEAVKKILTYVRPGVAL